MGGNVFVGSAFCKSRSTRKVEYFKVRSAWTSLFCCFVLLALYVTMSCHVHCTVYSQMLRWSGSAGSNTALFSIPLEGEGVKAPSIEDSY